MTKEKKKYTLLTGIYSNRVNEFTLCLAPKCFNLGAQSLGKLYPARLFIPQLSGQLALWELEHTLSFTVCMTVVSDYLDNV